MEIVALQERNHLFDEAVQVFWKLWGSEKNYSFYYDSMLHSIQTVDGISTYYVLLDNETIIGTYALIRNDLNSRQDLYPWLACLYVAPEYRGKKLGSLLLDHGLKEAGKRGFNSLYLSTDLEGYYEKHGWQRSAETYGYSGESIKVYEKMIVK